MKQNDYKMVGDDLTLTSNSKIDLARLPPCFSNLLPHEYLVNYSLAFHKRADEPFIETPNPYDDKQGKLKKPSNLLKPIRQIEPIIPRALVDIVDGVEQERELEVLTGLNWLSHCIIFQIRIRNESTDQKFVLSFVWLFSVLINQEIMLFSNRGQNIFED